jgi:hypothetical protein
MNESTGKMNRNQHSKEQVAIIVHHPRRHVIMPTAYDTVYSVFIKIALL